MQITPDTVVVVTGASSGIGRALALAVAQRGARVAVLARRLELLESLVAECRASGGDALAIGCDVAVRAQVEKAIELAVAHFGHIDVLVNNAGRGHFAYIDDTPEEQLESMFRVNVFSLWYATTAALRHMKPRRIGQIISIASLAGRIGYPANAAYVAAKHAVVGFSRALRTELAGTGIDVMTVIPAGVATDWATVTEGGPMLELFAYERERGDEIARTRGIEPPDPLPLLLPDDIAAAIVHAIEHPAPEIYTHPGSRDLVLQQELDPEAFARGQEPYWIANAEGYAAMKSGTADTQQKHNDDDQ